MSELFPRHFLNCSNFKNHSLTDALTQIMVVRSTLMMGLLVGFLFFQMPATYDRAFDRTGVALLVTLLSAVGVFNVVPLLMGDRNVMYRQTQNNRYERVHLSPLLHLFHVPHDLLPDLASQRCSFICSCFESS